MSVELIITLLEVCNITEMFVVTAYTRMLWNELKEFNLYDE